MTALFQQTFFNHILSIFLSQLIAGPDDNLEVVVGSTFIYLIVHFKLFFMPYPHILILVFFLKIASLWYIDYISLSLALFTLVKYS